MKNLLSLGLALTSVAEALKAPSTSSKQQRLRDGPQIVDLVYEKHSAIFDESGNFYNFTNIPYAQPPIGDLRWAKPKPITTESDKINDGSIGHICPQVNPSWVPGALAFVVSWTLGNYGVADKTYPWTKYMKAPLHQDPRANEDCLVLDVVVPKEIFDAKDQEDFSPVPVLVWLHGGGFIFGDKNQFGSPRGFFNATQSFEDSTQLRDGIIYVTLNYRLGAFGWLSAPEFIDQGGVANAGLWDQRQGLQWVHDHISKFGGDPDRVTVIGESAGASSILHHITSFAGPEGGYEHGTRPPFQRAILQSPAFFPQASNKQEKAVYDEFLKKSNANNLQELRGKSTEVVMEASNRMIYDSPHGQFTFGPAVDSDLVPAPPGVLLGNRAFWDDVEIMVAHNGNEGLLFTPQFGTTDAQFRTFISRAMPGLNSNDLEHIVKVMYPIVWSDGIKKRLQRVATAISEFGMLCNTQYLIDAFGEEIVYKYVFGVDPGMHGQDAFYTFFSPPVVAAATGIGNFSRVTAGTLEIAKTLQTYLVEFAKEGNPNHNGGEFVPFPTYAGQRIVHFTSTHGAGGPLDPIGHIASEVDPYVTMRERCLWWQDAPYWDTDDPDFNGDEREELK